MATARRARTSVVVLVLVQIIVSAAACHAADKWTVPAPSAPLAQLPRLSQPIAVDGDLSDWAGAVSVPVRHKADICFAAYGYQWRGPADISMEAYCGWRAEGLCLATVVADDVVENLRTDDEIYLEDSIELYVDGRPGNEQATSPYSPGAYQIMVTPPLPGREAKTIINGRDGDIQGLKAAGRATPAGYTIEALVPWSAFPELAPRLGARIAFNFAVNDYDGDDPKAERPVQLNRGGAQLMWEHPEGCIKWVLVDRVRTGEDVALEPAAEVDLPVLSGTGPVKLSVDCGTLLSDQVGSVRFQVVDADRRPLLDRVIAVLPLPAPWAASVHAELDWRPDRPAADGVAVVTAALNDKAGRPLGSVSQSMLMVTQTETDTLARLKAADVAKVSQTDPFRAAQYLGVGSCYERLKRSVEIQDRASAVQAARELPARLDVIDGRQVKPGSEGMTDLLNLTADPEAQVVVEYPMFPPSSEGPGVAYVTLNWGAIPLAGATVFEYSSRDKAAKRLEPNSAWILLGVSEKTSLDGLPATIPVGYRRRLFDLTEFEPDRQVALVEKRSQLLRVIAADLVPRAQVDAVTILPDCPVFVRDQVVAWAKQTGRPIVDLQTATEQDRVLVAGDVRTVADRLGKQGAFLYTLQASPTDLMVLAGNRVVAVTGPSRAICERVARLVLAGKPVLLSEVDALRQEMVRQLAPSTSPPRTPAGLSVYCGDVHMHSFYSDGTPSPVGLWLEALYNCMDFAVMTDHDTLEGALVAGKLLGEYGFSYPFIVGEEMSADWSDFGAYPVTTAILTSLPAYDMFKAAHVQGAVIQWDHPGGPFSDWTAYHLQHGIGDTSLDAWEHLPATYREWKSAGTLPVIIGSTDNHDCAFGGYPERTIILAPTPQGDDLAEAVRSRHALAVIPDAEFLYGSDWMLSVVWPTLAEGRALKSGTAERLRSALEKADLVGLLEASPPSPVALKDLAAN
jgi:hypothetical protein